MMTNARQGWANLAAGQIARAEAQFRAAVATDPGDASALAGLAFVARQAGRSDVSLALAHRAVVFAPEFSEGWSEFGRAELARGRRALGAFRRALLVKPDDALAAYLAGMAALTMNANAASYFKIAIGLAPALPDGYGGLAVALPSWALHALVCACTIAPHDGAMWLNQAVAAVAAESWDSAATALDRAEALGADPVKCAWLRADRAEAMGDRDQAADHRLSAYRTVEPTNIDDLPVIGSGLEVGGGIGWGTQGLQMAKFLADGRRARLVSLLPHYPGAQPGPGVSADDTKWRATIVAQSTKVLAHLARRSTGALPFDAVVPLGNSLAVTPLIGRPRRLFAQLALEDTRLDANFIERARRFHMLLPTSNWVEQILRANGIEHCYTLTQGADVDGFAPRSRRHRWPGRFVVFSGGKLEFRKGQDLVVRAFKQFQQRHRDALLVTAWHSPWPATARSIALSPHVDGAPALTAENQLDIAGWLNTQGLPPDSFVDVGRLDPGAFADLLAEVDVAVFPNRCEGGTNLVAMEAMTAGVPVILSANTGHLDLIEPDNCLVLGFQRPVARPGLEWGTDGWGESQIEEIVARLDQVYRDRDLGHRLGAAARRTLAAIAWPRQVDRLLKVMGI